MDVIRKRAVECICLFLAIYHIYAGFFGQPEAIGFRVTHVCLVLMLVFLLKPLKNASKLPGAVCSILDIGCLALIIFTLIYIVHDITLWCSKAGSPNSFDILLGTLFIIVLLEAGRRTVGLPIVVVALFFIANALYAEKFIGVLYGPSHSWKLIIDIVFIQDLGIFGTPVAVTASYVTLFIILGSLLVESGAGNFFTDLALAATGRQVGGPAKAAVLSSCVMGTISGSAVANVVTTGTFTIPLMKRVGYKPAFAGAVEAAASSGGQIMPPVMGAAAFIMAQFLGIPYLSVAKAAILPGLLYFISVFCSVHFEALRLKLRPMEKGYLPNTLAVLKKGWFLTLPLIALVYILIGGASPIKASSWAILILIVISFLRKESAMTPKRLYNAFMESSKALMGLSSACAVAGLIIGALLVSGTNWRLAGGIISATGGKLILGLLYVAVSSIVLGMGMTSTAVYLTVSAIAVPALIKMGVVEIGAHLFAFYFGCLSVITPPVALAAFAAAGIANANPNKVGFMAWKIGLTGFIVPFMFIYGPSLMLIGEPWDIIRAMITSIIGVVCLSSGLIGYLKRKLNIIERLLIIAAGMVLIETSLKTDLIGIAILCLIIILQFSKPWQTPLDRLINLFHFGKQRKATSDVELSITQESEKEEIVPDGIGPTEKTGESKKKTIFGWAVTIIVVLGMFYINKIHLATKSHNTMIIVMLLFALLWVLQYNMIPNHGKCKNK